MSNNNNNSLLVTGQRYSVFVNYDIGYIVIDDEKYHLTITNPDDACLEPGGDTITAICDSKDVDGTVCCVRYPIVAKSLAIINIIVGDKINQGE